VVLMPAHTEALKRNRVGLGKLKGIIFGGIDKA